MMYLSGLMILSISVTNHAPEILLYLGGAFVCFGGVGFYLDWSDEDNHGQRENNPEQPA